MFTRMYHVSSVACSIKKQAMKLNKMLNPRTKRQWYPVNTYEAATMPSLKALTKVEREPGKQGVRRLAMLNKLIMKHITDLMSTGTVSMEVVGRGIEVSKVKISPDFKTVGVFWVCKGDSQDEDTEAILNKTAGALRHELSTLRVMGEVPYIVFVKDKHESQMVDVDRLLAIADYGEDYTPTEMGHLLKTEFTLDTKISPEMKAKIKQLENEMDFVEDPIPEMTHNVFDLDHDNILNRLLAARKKSKDAWTNHDLGTTPVISYRAPEHPSGVDNGVQKQELADFLRKRQILHNKLHKRKNDLREDFQLLDDADDNLKPPEMAEEFENEDDYDSPEYYSGAPGKLQLGDKTDGPKF